MTAPYTHKSFASCMQHIPGVISNVTDYKKKS